MQIELHEKDLVGTFRTPDAQGPFPGVLALGGSDGGTPDYFLDLLVPEGFACLALAYWGTQETQLAFTEIPLERIERGLHWLAARREVATIDGRLAVMGASRGAELALLVAATFPDLVGPVVAYTPSSVAWVGIDAAMPLGTTRSSWSHRGAALPFVPFPEGAMPVRTERGLSLRPLCEGGLADREAVARAAIPIEQATGPLLVISGGDDRVWPCTRMCEMLVERMAQHGRSKLIEHMNFPDAGHMLFPYQRPADTAISEFPADLGGSPEADASAHAAAWERVVRKLRGS